MAFPQCEVERRRAIRRWRGPALAALRSVFSQWKKARVSVSLARGRGRGDAAWSRSLSKKLDPRCSWTARRQTKGERTRERILDVAYQSIVEKGFAATSIEELVEAAGITKSGFFYHFRDKNDMARQLFDRFLAEDDGDHRHARESAPTN